MILLYQPFQNHTIPSLCTITLASPRKRGGGTANIIFGLAVQYSDSHAFTILKLFRAVTVGIVNALEAFMVALLSISISYAPTNPSKTALPLPSTKLASLVKGRWIDGKTQTVTLLRLLAICLPFLYCKLFCRQDGGIAFLPHPFRFSDTSANNPSIVGSASHCNRSSPLHKGAKGDTALSTFPKPHYTSPSTTQIQNHRYRRHHNFSLFIIHYSFFIFHSSSLPLTLPQ